MKKQVLAAQVFPLFLVYRDLVFLGFERRKGRPQQLAVISDLQRAAAFYTDLVIW